MHVAEAVVERGAVGVAIETDDLHAADAGLADLPVGRVDDEEPTGCKLVYIAGEDRDRRDIRGRGRLTLVDPLADKDLERVMARVTDRCLGAGPLNPGGDLDDAAGFGGTGVGHGCSLM